MGDTHWAHRLKSVSLIQYNVVRRAVPQCCPPFLTNNDMSTIKINKNDIPGAAKNVILADIRRFLRDDCEYFWDEKTEMIVERDSEGNMCRLNFSLLCERVKAVKLNLNPET